MTTVPPVVSTSPYEFTEQQNAIVRQLASRMRVVGIGLVVVATLMAVRAVAARVDFGTLIWVAAAVLGCTGVWSLRASVELRRVVRTEGADIAHLVNALTEIRKLYDLQYWLVVGAALLAGATLLVAIGGSRWLPAAW